jgi:hypothetical protein
MQQAELFDNPGPIVWDVKTLTQAADRDRFTGITCWSRCTYCESEMHGSTRRRVYRRCSRMGCKCYPASEVCEWVDPPLPKDPPKPKSSGWGDF